MCLLIPLFRLRLKLWLKILDGGKANEYNTQLKAMCEKNGWTYIDVTSVTDDGDPKYYQADGVHFIRDIYPIWAQKMIDATINEEEHSK